MRQVKKKLPTKVKSEKVQMIRICLQLSNNRRTKLSIEVTHLMIEPTLSLSLES